jgi:hypothetical protein
LERQLLSTHRSYLQAQAQLLHATTPAGAAQALLSSAAHSVFGGSASASAVSDLMKSGGAGAKGGKKKGVKPSESEARLIAAHAYQVDIGLLRKHFSTLLAQ